MFRGFLESHEKGGVEDGVDFPSGENSKVEGCAGDDFLHFEGTSLLHLEFL